MVRTGVGRIVFAIMHAGEVERTTNSAWLVRSSGCRVEKVRSDRDGVHCVGEGGNLWQGGNLWRGVARVNCWEANEVAGRAMLKT